jgi:hypothetical protein
MPIGFDINQPANVASMVAALGPYATQDAAERDIPSDAQDYLNASYRRVTGDQSSSIFNDVFNAKQTAATAAATAGAPVDQHTPVNAEGAALSSWAAREVAGGAYNTEANKRGADYQLSSQEMQLPPAGAENYADVQRHRAMLSGNADLFDLVSKYDPHSLAPSEHATDPLFQRLAGNGKQPGKVIGAEDLHHVALNPKFQEAMRRDPEKAKQFYSDITGGRHYDTDLAATIEQRKQNTDLEDKAIEDIRTRGKWNPVLGTFTLRKTVKDASGFGQVETEEPLSDVQQAILDKRGIQSVYPSVDMSRFHSMEMPRGLSPQEETVFRKAVFQDLAQNPGKDVKTSIQNVYQKFHLAQNPTVQKANPIVKMLTAQDPSTREIPAFMTAGDMASGVNRVSNFVNQMIPRTGPAAVSPSVAIPRIGAADQQMSPLEAMRRRAALDSRAIPAPTASGRSLASYFLPSM